MYGSALRKLHVKNADACRHMQAEHIFHHQRSSRATFASNVQAATRLATPLAALPATLLASPLSPMRHTKIDFFCFSRLPDNIWAAHCTHEFKRISVWRWKWQRGDGSQLTCGSPRGGCRQKTEKRRL